MQISISKKSFFYDYFPHLPLMRMRLDFNMGSYEQSIVKQQVQNMICRSYDRLINLHDLKHANVYLEIGDEFDEEFYGELKDDVKRQLHNLSFWRFLDNLIREQAPGNKEDLALFRAKLLPALNHGLPPNNYDSFRKDAFVALFNLDIDALSGKELLYLTKIS